jgi:hypothetical protein
MKWFIFILIIGGVVVSTFQTPMLQTKKETNDLHSIAENIRIASDVSFQNETKNNLHFLFIIKADQGKIEKSIIAKLSDDSSKVEIAPLQDRVIEEVVNDKIPQTKDPSQVELFKGKIASMIEVPVDHIIIVEKQSLIAMFDNVFPKGIPLHLSAEMKKDLKISSKSDPYMNASKFLKSIKTLKETHKYELELNEMIIKTVSSQLSTPDVLLSLMGTITNIDQYLYTDLKKEEIFALGMHVMKNPVLEVQKLEKPPQLDQEVLDSLKTEINPF